MGVSIEDGRSGGLRCTVGVGIPLCIPPSHYQGVDSRNKAGGIQVRDQFWGAGVGGLFLGGRAVLVGDTSGRGSEQVGCWLLIRNSSQQRMQSTAAVPRNTNVITFID